MDLVNERVEHIKFGIGVIIEADDHKIAVQFQDMIGAKSFPYPETFERFLKALNPAVQDNAMDECRRKQQQIELERQRMEKEREATKLEEKKEKAELAREKATRARRGRKS